MSNPFSCMSRWNSPTSWSTLLGSDACLALFVVKFFNQFWVLSCSVRSPWLLPAVCSSYCCFAAENALSMPYVTRGVLFPAASAVRGTQDCLQLTAEMTFNGLMHWSTKCTDGLVNIEGRLCCCWALQLLSKGLEHFDQYHFALKPTQSSLIDTGLITCTSVFVQS